MLAFIYFTEHKEDLLAAKRRNQTCVTQFFAVAIVAGEFNTQTKGITAIFNFILFHITK